MHGFIEVLSSRLSLLCLSHVSPLSLSLSLSSFCTHSSPFLAGARILQVSFPYCLLLETQEGNLLPGAPDPPVNFLCFSY